MKLAALVAALALRCFVSGSVSAATLEVDVTIDCNPLGAGLPGSTGDRASCD
jgi:hypothetical protein